MGTVGRLEFALHVVRRAAAAYVRRGALAGKLGSNCCNADSSCADSLGFLLLFLCADIANKFAASAWGKKLAARQAKANMSDLDRYKAMVAKCKRSRLVRTAFNKLKKSA